MSSAAPLHPCGSTLNSLLALDSFLSSLPADPPPLRTNSIYSTAVDTSTTNESAEVNAAKQIEARRKLILRVADCLFGCNLLEGAISILDSYVVTEVVSVTSRRQIFVLTNPAARRRNNSSNRHEEPHTYFCLVPPPPPPPPESQSDLNLPPAKNDKRETRTRQGGGNGFFFCSCRSYFERKKSSACAVTGGGQSGDPQALIVCKHLLALKLRSHLQENYKVIETVTEDQFSQEILNRLYGGSRF